MSAIISDLESLVKEFRALEGFKLQVKELQEDVSSRDMHIMELNSELKNLQEELNSKDKRITELNNELKNLQEDAISKDKRIAELTMTISKIRHLTEGGSNAECSSCFTLSYSSKSIYAYLRGILKEDANVDADLFEKILLTEGKPNGNYICGKMVADAIMGKKEPGEYYLVNIVTCDVPYMLSLLLSLGLTQHGSNGSNRFFKNMLLIYVYQMTDRAKASKDRLHVYKDFVHSKVEAFFDFENVYDLNYSFHYKQRFHSGAVLPQEIVYKYNDPTYLAARFIETDNTNVSSYFQ